MDFLLQHEINKESGVMLIHEFIQKVNNNLIGLEPYPTSLRCINWIKFLTKFEIRNAEIDNSLFVQYNILADNLEYHLLGNHLLENGFSLLFGAFYFHDLGLYDKAKKIIEGELNEQILNDGAHFELSPMYHQIILDRLLDCVNLIQHNVRFKDQEKLLTLMQAKGILMVGWLNAMTFSNGQIPMLNDSAPEIAPSTKKLNNYAIRLGIISEVNIREFQLKPNMKDSGYRRFNGSNYECIIDVGQIGPDYQPGHAHADTFNFVFVWNNRPMLVDNGISTYQKNSTRQIERSTISHNTVTIAGINSSEVWNGFRVGKRAKVNLIKDSSYELIATHDGYSESQETIHQRTFSFSNDSIVINDRLVGKKKIVGECHLHFHPDISVRLEDNKIILDESICVYLQDHHEVMLCNYQFPLGFNLLRQSLKCVIQFEDSMRIAIRSFEN